MNQIARSPQNTLSTRIGWVTERLNARLSADEAAQAAATIVGAYPYGKANDADCYIRSLTALLSTLPAEVARTIADPRYGIVTTCKFLPVMAEISEMADEISADLHAQRDALQASLRSERAIVRQLEDRREQSEEDRSYVAAGLKDLRDEMVAAVDVERKKPPPRPPVQCKPGEAIMHSDLMADVRQEGEQLDSEAT